MTRAYLPDEFFVQNEFAARGVVEYGFTSTTTRLQVATSYASGAASIVMMLTPGFVDRGASIAWLSQYPTEEEVLYPALLALHIIDTKVDAINLVIHARPSVNLKAQTLEQVANRRKQVVVDMSTSLSIELSNSLRQSHDGGVNYSQSGTSVAIIGGGGGGGAAHGGGVHVLGPHSPDARSLEDLLDAMFDDLRSEDPLRYLRDEALSSAITFGVSARTTAGAMQSDFDHVFQLVIASGALESTELELSGHKLRDAATGTLSRLLLVPELNLRFLRSMQLSRNGISEVGGWLLFEAMGQCTMPALRSINLSENEIGDRALSRLSRTIEAEALPRLRALNLWSNSFGDEGLCELAGALDAGSHLQRPCPKLWCVEFEFNKITNLGREQMLAYLSSITAELSSANASPFVPHRGLSSTSLDPLVSALVAPLRAMTHLPERYFLRDSALVASTLSSGHAASESEQSHDARRVLLLQTRVDELRTLEDVIGAPMNQLLEGMRREHYTGGAESRIEFNARGFSTQAEIEWLYVTDPLCQRTAPAPDWWTRDGTSFVYPGTPIWWERNEPDEERRLPPRAQPSAEEEAKLVKQLRRINAQLAAANVPTLLVPEFFAARLYMRRPRSNRGHLIPSFAPVHKAPSKPILLFLRSLLRCRSTGPMGDRYRDVLQQHIDRKLQRKTRLAAGLQYASTFTTTIHVLSSAILKLSQIASNMTIYASLSPESGGLARSVSDNWQTDAFSATVLTSLSATRSGERAFHHAASSNCPIVFQMKLSPSSQVGADLSWLSQWPLELEVALPPLVRLHVTGRRTLGSVEMVELSVQSLLALRTVEQIQRRMQQMHLEMLQLVESNCRNAGMPGSALAMLQQMHDEAKFRSWRWYHSHSNFRQATQAALKKQREALQMMARRDIWQHEVQSSFKVEDVNGKVAKARVANAAAMKTRMSLIGVEYMMAQAAELAADLDEHEVAIHILRMWLEENSLEPRCKDAVLATVAECTARSISLSADDVLRLHCAGYALLFKRAERPWPATILKLVGDAAHEAERRISIRAPFDGSNASDTNMSPRSNTSSGYLIQSATDGGSARRVGPIPSAGKGLLNAFSILVRTSLDVARNDAPPESGLLAVGGGATASGATGRVLGSFFSDPFEVGASVFIQHIGWSEGGFTAADVGKELRISQGDLQVAGMPRSVHWADGTAPPPHLVGVIESVEPAVDAPVIVRAGGNDGLFSAFTSTRHALRNPPLTRTFTGSDWMHATVTSRRVGEDGGVEIDARLANGMVRTGLPAGGAIRKAEGKVHVLGVCDDGPAAILRLAASEGRAQLVNALLDAGVSPEVTDSACTSIPLLDAAKNGHVRTCQVLVDHGAIVELQNAQQRSAYDICLMHEHFELADVLKPRMSDLDVTDRARGEMTDVDDAPRWVGQLLLAANEGDVGFIRNKAATHLLASTARAIHTPTSPIIPRSETAREAASPFGAGASPVSLWDVCADHCVTPLHLAARQGHVCLCAMEPKTAKASGACSQPAVLNALVFPRLLRRV